MREHGVSPPPKAPISERGILTSLWDKWFQRLVSATPKVATYTATLNPASVSANSTSEQTFTVNGLKTSDIVTVNKPSHDSGLGIVNARVSAADTLAITFMNTTGSGINPPSEDYLIHAIRR